MTLVVRAVLWVTAYLGAVLTPLVFAAIGASDPDHGFWTDFSVALGFVGPLVALCWMHHAQSPLERAVRLERHAGGAAQWMHGTELNAEAWLSDPALSTDWPVWRRM